MMTKITSMKDLQQEKRMLRYEIDATEKLLIRALQTGKTRVINSAVSAIFPVKESMPGEIQLLQPTAASTPRNQWIKRILTFLPVFLKIYRGLKRSSSS